MPNDDDEEQLQDDLDATSESLESDAQRVASIEAEKQGLKRGDPRVASLSREAERLAGDIENKSRVERDLSEGSNDEPEGGAGQGRARPS